MRLLRLIGKNLVEGQLLKVTFKTISCFFSRLRTVIDWSLVVIPRLILSYSSEIDDKKVIFMTYNDNYMCNQKYICEEILKQELPLDVVWVTNNKQLMSGQYPENVRLVIRGSYDFFKELATAKVWVDNALCFTWNPIPKKKGQFYLQTWHGSLGLKRIGKEDVKNRRWSFAATLAGKWTDLCVSNSTFETEVFRQTHWPKTPIQELGHARNDILFADETQKSEIKERVHQYFDIPEGCHIALYAPTFRNGDNVKYYNLDHARFLDALEKKFGGDWVLLNRYHFKTKAARKKKTEDDRILSATEYPDIQELMVAADLGVTDYSSWICDFVLTEKPGLIYAPDLAEYDHERGFYYPLSQTPFLIAQNNDELEACVLSFDGKHYERKRKAFLDARGCKEDGHASEKIVEIIKKQCGLA